MPGDFKWRHFRGKIILGAVRWYCKYGISYRDLEEMMGERGVKVDHSTLFRWVQRYAPEIERRLRWAWRSAGWRGSWRVDETYIKVRGQWAYLYRAVTSAGDTIDFYLSPTRNAKAAKRFLGKALGGFKDWEKPHVINTDKAPTYAIAIRELKGDGKCPADTEHRQVKYLNNVTEADHGKLKRLIKPTLGFKTLRTAYATIKGFEVMRAFRKNQARPWCLQPGAQGEIRLIERAFNLGPNVEDVARLRNSLQQSRQSCVSPTRTCKPWRCCESNAEERGAGNPHATFCGNRERSPAPGDPVTNPKSDFAKKSVDATTPAATATSTPDISRISPM